MSVLLWLLPAVLATGAAMLWAAWVGRERPERERSAADDARFAEAISKPMPTARDLRATPRRSTTTRSGVVLRPTGSRPVDPSGPVDQSRRSA